MHPIHLRSGDSDLGMSAAQFREKVIAICNQHRAEKRALVFVFLLFDRRHGQVARVLEEPRFYETLNEIAGSLLTVFFIHSEALQPGKTSNPWAHQANEVAKLITDQFEVGADWNREKPAILFFQVEDNRISQARFASFDDERREETFIAIKRLLKTAAESIAKVQPEFSANSNEIFSLVDNAISNDAFYKKLPMIYKAVRVIAVIKGLSWFWGFLAGR
jgi:hypothetical protein